MQLDGVEGFGADVVVIAMYDENAPTFVLEAQHLERAIDGVDQPRVPDLLSRV